MNVELFTSDRRGSTSIEHCLLAALVGVVCLFAAEMIGTDLSALFTNFSAHKATTDPKPPSWRQGINWTSIAEATICWSREKWRFAMPRPFFVVESHTRGYTISGISSAPMAASGLQRLPCARSAWAQDARDDRALCRERRGPIEGCGRRRRQSHRGGNGRQRCSYCVSRAGTKGRLNWRRHGKHWWSGAADYRMRLSRRRRGRKAHKMSTRLRIHAPPRIGANWALTAPSAHRIFA